MSRIAKARTMAIALPTGTRMIGWHGQQWEVPVLIKRDTYCNRRDRGMTHEQACSTRMAWGASASARTINAEPACLSELRRRG